MLLLQSTSLAESRAPYSKSHRKHLTSAAFLVATMVGNLKDACRLVLIAMSYPVYRFEGRRG